MTGKRFAVVFDDSGGHNQAWMAESKRQAVGLVKTILDDNLHGENPVMVFPEEWVKKYQ